MNTKLFFTLTSKFLSVYRWGRVKPMQILRTIISGFLEISHKIKIKSKRWPRVSMTFIFWHFISRIELVLSFVMLDFVQNLLRTFWNIPLVSLITKYYVQIKTLTSDPWPPKSIQLKGKAKWIFRQCLVKVPCGIDLSCSLIFSVQPCVMVSIWTKCEGNPSNILVVLPSQNIFTDLWLIIRLWETDL